MAAIKGTIRRVGITRERIPSIIALLVCPVVTFYLFDFFTHNPFTTMSFRTQMLNIAFYQITGILLWGVVSYAHIALMLQSMFFLLVGLANYYVLSFRSAPIMPWDIFSIGTAASVMDNYSYELGMSTIAVILLFVGLMYIESHFRMKAPMRKLKRLTIVGLGMILTIGYTGMIQNTGFVADFGLYDKLFTPTTMTFKDGSVVAFIMEMAYLDVDKPSGYSQSKAEGIYNSLGEANAAGAYGDSENHRPNVIVIMDEAFSDLAVLGELETERDYMPYVHSLMEGTDNTVTGFLDVSVLGGNTANTEFEFLTGNTLAFLPAGSVAYQQYINDDTESLAAHLKNMGYSTVAIHPYNAGGWDRDRVYPLLGFDEFISAKDFVNPLKIRNYISDRSSFKMIKEVYENKAEGQPLFVFNVTMQNHSGYEDDNYFNLGQLIEPEGINSESLPTYLALMNKTDEAFKDLVTYFSRVEEDTIIVMFGDHQPTSYVSNPILRANGIDPDNLSEEENLLRYKTPYVIWANFDIEESAGNETSANYLALQLMEQAGLPLSNYQVELSKVQEQYPVITGVQIRNAEGELVELKDVKKDLNEYMMMQYYLLFDR